MFRKHEESKGIIPLRHSTCFYNWLSISQEDRFMSKPFSLITIIKIISFKNLYFLFNCFIELDAIDRNIVLQRSREKSFF